MTRYPKPSATGGKLIRDVIQFLRSRQIALPISSHILIAVSGGPDSVALAHLLSHYGRRVGLKKQIRILHINHGWRGEESDGDAQFVRALGKAWGVPVTIRKLRKPKQTDRSWEEFAREQRKEIYEAEALKHGAIVMTAHQADDLAETMIWRLFTGAIQTHGAGIRVLADHEVRPFLKIRKQILIQYLKEEGVEWRNDRTNLEGRFLRSKMRLLLMPAIESLFPRAIEHLVEWGLSHTSDQGSLALSHTGEIIALASRVIDQGLRRSHWNTIRRNIEKNPQWRGEIHLPGDWKLSREPLRKSSGERWVLEKT